MQAKRWPGGAVILGVLAIGIPYVHAADKYPERPIRIIVPFAPGGASDFVGRIIQPKLGEELGQTIVIDNRAGASGSIGVEVAANATADGYTILLGNIGTMAINPYVFPKFQPKPLDAFVGVTQVVDVPLCLEVHPSVPVNSVRELIDYAKARPGKLNYAAAGAGSNGTLAFEYWKRLAGLSIVMIAYKGGAGGAALGNVQGEAQVSLLSTPSVLPYVKTGRLKLLAVVARKRISAAPEVPTMAESGYPDMTNGSWQGVYVPKGAPKAVVSRLFPAVTHAMKDPEVVRQLGTASAVAIVSNSPSDFEAFWKKENARWAKVVTDVGAVAQK